MRVVVAESGDAAGRVAAEMVERLIGVALSDRTRADNARFFPDTRPVPDRAITQGTATICAAGELVLLACGEHKADAVARAVEGPVTPDLPASAVQLHANVTVVLDPPAASLIP